jgi:hypothetical protein
VVDIVNNRLRVDELNEILDDLDHIGVGEHTSILVDSKVPLLVESVTSYIAEVISLF